MTRNSVIHSGLALVASALCACGGHGSAGKTVETEDGGTAVGGTFVPQVGGVPDAAPALRHPVPCGSLGLGSVLATAFSPDGTL
jgi:hypothetical protein